LLSAQPSRVPRGKKPFQSLMTKPYYHSDRLYSVTTQVTQVKFLAVLPVPPWHDRSAPECAMLSSVLNFPVPDPSRFWKGQRFWYLFSRINPRHRIEAHSHIVPGKGLTQTPDPPKTGRVGHPAPYVLSVPSGTKQRSPPR
jgi:hypothetical protein